MKLGDLVRDKRKLAWAAAGTGAVVGVVVWLRRRASGSTGSSTSSGGGGGIANPAYANTTGTDVANWLGNTLGQYSDQLAAYQHQLQQLVTQQPPADSGSGPGGSAPASQPGSPGTRQRWLALPGTGGPAAPVHALGGR